MNRRNFLKLAGFLAGFVAFYRFRPLAADVEEETPDVQPMSTGWGVPWAIPWSIGKSPPPPPPPVTRRYFLPFLRKDD